MPNDGPELGIRFSLLASRTQPGSHMSSKSASGRSGRIRNEKRRRVYEYYWAPFAAEIHLSE